AENSPTGQHAFVHVAEQVMVEPTDRLFQEDTNFIPPYVHYRCRNAEMGEAAARIAVGWADTTRRVTPYGSTPDPTKLNGTPKGSKVNRFGAMVTTGALDAIPFELNALIRVVKWAYKAHQTTAPLSENRGATCSAFVGSCYQTAYLSAFF